LTLEVVSRSTLSELAAKADALFVEHARKSKLKAATDSRSILSSISSTNSASTSGWYRVARTDLTAVSGPVALRISSPGQS